MAETKTRLPQSHIPVKASASRPAQSALPSSFSSHHSGLVPPSRHLSVSDSPTHPSPNASPASNATAGLTSFRSFRNLLPFGPSKLPNPNASPSASYKSSPFSNLGAIRRSMNGERSVSAPQLRPKNSQEYPPPVFSIELSHKVNEPLIKPEDLRSGLGLYTKQPESPLPQSAPVTSLTFQPRVASPPSPKPVGVSDLSTIIESETSGISKYVPNLDDSQENPSYARHAERREPLADAHLAQDSHPPDQSFLVPPPTKSERLPTPGSQDTSPLDLSTSKVTNEVLEALANDHQDGWLHGIVVDDAEGVAVDGPDDPNSSFNLGSLDPDLAALLSPNRIRTSDGGLLLSIDALAPLPTTPPMSDSYLASPTASPFTPLPPGGSSKAQSIITDSSPILTARSVGSQSSPVRRPTPLARSTSASAVPSSQSPPTCPPSAQAKNLLPSAPILTAAQRTSDVGERPGSASVAAGRRKGYAPVTPESEVPRRPHTGGDAEPRRPALSRLMTPIRPALQLTPASGSRSSARGGNSTGKASPSAWDGDSISPSSVGTSHGRPSLDSSADRLRTSAHVHSRDRSASVSDRPVTFYGSSARLPAAEWLGPRTVKAFAAAGLIDVAEKDGSQAGPSRPGSRFGTTRSQSERDSRSQYAPSRMAFSEAGSTSSWGRRSGSISRTGAMSEMNGTLSESASTPRTTFSSGSTALTSVSSTSVSQQLQSELQIMQDKHALETGALLNALSDSQRTSKMLRDENTELRDRLHELEGRLADAVNEIQRLQYQVSIQQTIPSYSRGSYQRPSGLRPIESMGIRKQPSRLQTVVHSRVDADDDDEVLLHPPQSYPQASRSSSESRREDLYAQPPPKRFSNTSSIFPIPPSTMSMLLHEEGIAPEAFSTHSRSPPSPTVTLSKHTSRQSQGSSYGHHRSTSATTTMTVGNISPTTANFSMLTGSPGSLNLRPEHERLLGDMPPLNLGADDYELDSEGG